MKSKSAAPDTMPARHEGGEAVEALRKGDKVVTTGGLHGVVDEIDKEGGTISLQVDRNVRLTFNRSAIAPLAKPVPAKKSEAAPITEPAKG